MSGGPLEKEDITKTTSKSLTKLAGMAIGGSMVNKELESQKARLVMWISEKFYA